MIQIHAGNQQEMDKQICIPRSRGERKRHEFCYEANINVPEESMFVSFDYVNAVVRWGLGGIVCAHLRAINCVQDISSQDHPAGVSCSSLVDILDADSSAAHLQKNSVSA